MLVKALTYPKIFLAICILSFTVKGLSNENDKKQNSEINKILKIVDEVFRSDSSYAEVRMIVKNENWERTMEIEMWTKGMEKTLITIRSPKKDAGITTLKIDTSMWNYFPKVNKIMKVPPSMMMGSWMGTDMTNDDLVKDSTYIEDYNARFLESKSKNEYFIELTPKKETVSVWAKIEMRIDKKTSLPIEQVSYNERNDAVRKFEFSEIKKIGGKTIPTKYKISSLTKETNSTTVIYDKAEFNIPINDSKFSRRNLQKQR